MKKLSILVLLLLSKQVLAGFYYVQCPAIGEANWAISYGFHAKSMDEAREKFSHVDGENRKYRFHASLSLCAVSDMGGGATYDKVEDWAHKLANRTNSPVSRFKVD